ncbi:MAG TPA: HIT domain-containing protein [Bacteroidota bacterium]
MKRMFSPWRSQYIESFKHEKKKKKGDCLFCRLKKERNDEKNLVLLRKEFCFVVMNRYPYNSGHLMIVPYTHTSDFEGLSREEYAEVMETTSEMIAVLGKVSQPQGFNFGANIGRVAGAGIDHHVHFHLVPRWNGDTNFMSTIGEVKLISEDMKQTYRNLRKALMK